MDGFKQRPRESALGVFVNTHMECGLSTAQGLVARGWRGGFGGESASAVVEVCVATRMGGLVPGTPYGLAQASLFPFAAQSSDDRYGR
jgi:hypothetical protein